LEGLSIRKMRHEDLDQVHAIETRCFSTPWQLTSFKYEIDNIDAILKVASFDIDIVGYVCIRNILDVTHVLDIAVKHDVRHMGIASMLLSSALQELRTARPDTKTITLEVRESNIAAIRLYEKFGFNEIGRRRDYYKKPTEDAVLMGLDVQ
jgi:ribosomal-protein-alanine N-acetyltransferase